MNDHQRKMARKSGKTAGYRYGGRVRYAEGGAVEKKPKPKPPLPGGIRG